MCLTRGYRLMSLNKQSSTRSKSQELPSINTSLIFNLKKESNLKFFLNIHNIILSLFVEFAVRPLPWKKLVDSLVPAHQRLQVLEKLHVLLLHHCDYCYYSIEIPCPGRLFLPVRPTLFRNPVMFSAISYSIIRLIGRLKSRPLEAKSLATKILESSLSNRCNTLLLSFESRDAWYCKTFSLKVYWMKALTSSIDFLLLQKIMILSSVLNYFARTFSSEYRKGMLVWGEAFCVFQWRRVRCFWEFHAFVLQWLPKDS